MFSSRKGTVSDRRSIEWTEATWNPTTGCDNSFVCDKSEPELQRHTGTARTTEGSLQKTLRI
jgi:protein gp37